MSCYIFNKSLLMDADINSSVINITALKRLIPSFSPDLSGLWQPVIIKKQDNTLNKVDFLKHAEDNYSSFEFDPLNCSPRQGESYSALISNKSFGCSYCDYRTYTFEILWNLKDSDGNIRRGRFFGDETNGDLHAGCCNGACDTRMKLDDYIPKIPVLNQNYLKKFYDFKHLNQFPASTNPGIGFNEFIKIGGLNMSSFSSSPDLIIDWRIKDTISEISYNKLTSQYDTQYHHNKALKKAKMVSQTCGNFILTKCPDPGPETLGDYGWRISSNSLLNGLISATDQSTVSNNIEEILPSVEDYTKPYGFDKNTYNNIFIKNKKMSSYWKWNYESGVLCWYRYYNKDIDPDKDERPIKGVDLYISPGDVFFATSDGPEPTSELRSYNRALTNNGSSDFDPGGIPKTEIRPCPSGLKVLNSGDLACVIPSGSSFTYISENLYSKFLNIFNKISLAARTDNYNITMKQKFELAALLCTAPEYDGITVDLMSRNKRYNYDINSYFQIDILNKDMLKGTSYGSVGKLNYIKNKTDLINTLADKYGAYLWCAPNTTTDIKLKNPINSQCLIDLDFDTVTLDKNVKFASTSSCKVTTDCSYNLPERNKNFSYSQKFTLGQSVLELKSDSKTRYNVECFNNTTSYTKSARVAGLYLNNSLIKEVIYHSGCYNFQDNYPRIITPTTPSDTCCNGFGINCDTCDADSSYYLVGGSGLCFFPYAGPTAWCDAPSAKYANNNDPNLNLQPENFRQARNILNNSLYHKRSYNAVAFDPHIDMVAFHHQGGVHYINSLFGNVNGTTVFTKNTSNLFDDSGQGELSISFSTKDVGIKIYSVTIEKLRGSGESTYSCRAFPIKDRCKCFGLNSITDFPYVCNDGGSITFTNDPILFTPNISTTFSPKIKAYGGYKEEKINEMLGGGEISNSIKVLRKEIEFLNKTIDFMELSDLTFDKDGISISTYRDQRVNKSGQIDSLRNELSEYRIPNHPDPEIYLPTLDKYIDPLNPYGTEQSVSVSLNNYVTTDYAIKFPSYTTNHADIWAEVSENVNFSTQRYTTKVTFNDQTVVYDQQKKPISLQNNSSTTKVKLSNPYLEALLGREYILYPPAGSLCSKVGNFGSRGDELSTVNITFSRIPRKQLLNFYIKQPKPMGILKKGFFHPNSGLIDREPRDPPLSPLYKDSGNNLFIAYDKTNFNPDTKFSDKGVVFYSEINDSVRRVIQQIGAFNSHRKPRLYLQLNNLWYEYKTPNLFGFYNQDTLNIGEPYIFEYLDDTKNYSTIGPWLPVSAKKHLDFNFIYNYPNKNIPISYQQPIIIKNQQKPKRITIDGSRAYFYIKEIDTAIVSLANSIPSLSEDDMSAISAENPEVILSTGERFRYISGAKNQRSSYIVSDYNYLYKNYSDLHINYNLKNKENYVYNTKKACNQKIIIINADNNTQTYEAIIKEKKLYAVYTDEGGNKLKFNDSTSRKYIKIYTQFELETPLKYDKAYIDFSCLYGNFDNLDGIDSLILLRNLKDNQALKKENDQNLYNDVIQSKWGDLLDYDNNLTSELTKYFIDKKYIYDIYPSSLYANNFYKTIINNCEYLRHRFLLKNNTKSIYFDLADDIYFNIHQKYNIDYELYKTHYDYWKHNNYLPYMDFNILPTGDDKNSSRRLIKDQIRSILPGKQIFSGIINISGLYQNLGANHSWGDYKQPSEGKYFWINLDTSLQMLSAPSPKKGFYIDSMRVDTPPFQYNKIEYSEINSNTVCRQRYSPKVNNISVSFPNDTFDFSHYQTSSIESVFDIANIYCDKDIVSGCSNADCNLVSAGTGLYKAIYDFYTHTTIDIPTKIDNIPYIISYDAGLYAPLGNKSISYITRHELEPYNPLFPVSICDSNISPRPKNHTNSIFNEEYQKVLADSRPDNHTTIVKNTDTLANEMLFRLMYGEQQKINYERIDGSDDRVKLEDLFRSSYPKTKAHDLYKNIQYDMDTTADCSGRKVSGSISINGVLELNKTVLVNINNIDITISIRQDPDTGAVNIVAESSYLPDGQIISKIYDTKEISKSIIVSTGDVFDSGPNNRVVLAAECAEKSQRSIELKNGIVYAEIHGVQSCNRPVIQPCSQLDRGDFIFGIPEPTVAIFPRWRPEDLPDSILGCNGLTKPPYSLVNGEFQGCGCGKLNCKTGIASLPDNLQIYFWGHNGGSTEMDPSFMMPTNRGVGPVDAPNGCFVISENTEEITINEGDYNRGAVTAWGNLGNSCFVANWHDGFYASRNISPGTRLRNVGFDYDLGQIQDVVPTKIMVDSPYSPSSRKITTDCGLCYSIDSEDPLTGKNRYEPTGRDFPPVPTSTADACECEDFTYGYCRNSDNAAACVCKSLRYDYDEFPYQFEYCKHSITLIGHKRRINGRVNPDSN